MFSLRGKNISIYGASAPYLKHRENTCTLAQNTVLLYKSLVFSRVFFGLIIHRYLLCSRALRKTTRKHLHFCQMLMFFFHIPGNLQCLVSFDGQRNRMHFYMDSCQHLHRHKQTCKNTTVYTPNHKQIVFFRISYVFYNVLSVSVCGANAFVLRSICRHLHFVRNHTKTYTFRHNIATYQW